MSDTVNCSYCQAPIAPGEPFGTCEHCGAPAHLDCWNENQGCAVYGCKSSPEVEKRSEVEVPVSWWGRETKPCPACNQEILAAAVRCRHCGATFASARPEDRFEYRARAELHVAQPALRRTVIVQFVLSIIPFTAPLGLFMGLFWYLPSRKRVATLPPLHGALARLALIISALQVTAAVVLTTIVALSQSSVTEIP